MYSFLCKQGQELEVVKALNEYGKPHVRKYSGNRGAGVMVELDSNLSNRFLDRALYKKGVKGAVARRNLPVVKVEFLSDLRYADLVGKRFVLVYNGKIGRAKLELYRPSCGCCSDEYRLYWKGEEYSFC